MIKKKRNLCETLTKININISLVCVRCPKLWRNIAKYIKKH